MENHFRELEHQMEDHFRELEHQDWKSIIINKKENKPKSKNISNLHAKELKIHKLADNDELSHKKVPDNIRKLIQTKRSELKWTKKDLAQKTNLQLSIINEIESGKAFYNFQHINKIKRTLKIK